MTPSTASRLAAHARANMIRAIDERDWNAAKVYHQSWRGFSRIWHRLNGYPEPPCDVGVD